MSSSNEEFQVFDVTPDPDLLSRKNQKPEEKGSVSIRKLYRYINWFDGLMLLLGLCGSLAAGILQPMMMLVMGDMIDAFQGDGSMDASLLPQIPLLPLSQQYVINQQIFEMVESTVHTLVLKMLYFGLGNMAAGFLQSFCFFVLSQRQSIKIRILYFTALMRQDMGWYDHQESGELTSKIASDVQEIEDGMSQKFGMIFQTLAAFISGYALGFAKSWDLTLVLLCSAPFMMGAMFFLGVTATIMTSKGSGATGKAGAIAEETIGNMRTVHSLSQEKSFCAAYDANINKAGRFHVIRGLAVGIGFGAMMFVMMCSLALGSWYGSLVIQGKGGSHNGSPGTVMVVFMAVLMATQSLAMIAIPLNVLSTARGAAFRIYNTIDRIPDIDATTNVGLKPEVCNGNITLEDVQFRYPTRPTKQILGGLDLSIPNGNTIALVGASGCGKSTTIQLVQRLYDPVGGSVKLDGNDLRSLNLKWLRNQIGLVGQEPVLFACTIKQNILLGAKDDETPTEDDVIECAKMANAHDFIMHLPDKYDTLVGEKGASLSGGQKQRIAIARALIRRPKILLLDEATSALDTQSEKIVQQALEKASEGRTTIVVAHRLTTVKNASRICVFHQGEIIESGTHQELMDLKGTYYGLVKRQSMEEEVDQDQVEEDLKKFREEENKEAETMMLHKENTVTMEPANIVEELESDYNNEVKHLKKSNQFALWRTLWDNFSHEYIMCTLGLIGGIGGGAIFPFFTLKFIDIIMVLMVLSPSVPITDEQQHTIFKTCMIIIGIGAGAFCAFFLYIGLMLSAGEKMLTRMRRNFYKAIIRQDVSWFDRKENMVGAVTTRLSADPTTVKGISGERVGNVIQLLSTCGFALGIAFYYEWKTALCILAVTPVLMVIVFINGKLNKQQSSPATIAYEKSGITLVEAVESVRTIHTLTKEPYFIKKYVSDLHKPLIGIYKWGPSLAITQALNNLVTFCINSYGFYIGVVILKKNLNFQVPFMEYYVAFMDGFMRMQKAMMSVVFAAQSVGNFGTIVPDIGKAIEAAKKTFDVIDRVPKIDVYNETGDIFEGVEGDVEFKDICFRYPSRPENSVLKGISFKAEKGKTVALVGASGCGKSTSVQLIERFYDPTHGEVLLDGHNVKGLNIQFLRNQIGMVGQEPVLFAETVMENIKRGIPKGMEVTNDDIYAAAKMANAHDFISAMPEGYNTEVGDRGSQMSGGQKQRIAIARALIRNPKVLLLDEATSALDSESEKIVQDALDKASKGRTTIVIAHRLSTIQGADQICVIMRGKIAERGTHEELLKLKGFYYTLAMQQFGSV
ncbi:bile salt export pump, putative [Entamoeba invadens IP1]|uniref:ABC-type xenobiotic transporter n=1 Tax=Entamoeba invadens IP1 TaxID=370355 RepID=A0A0A1U882_ENTIV|nr:bile salt export pump, putative [Entamoeba invadens IP1]ELP88188.1 bile salt export pump, putative [Entamoeba invadens IP1]|eukprot:XP_004254959.1 bile salt export pump, putative [Entamoeba invadens IP1]